MFGFKGKDDGYRRRMLPATVVSAALLPLFFLVHTTNSFNLPLVHRSSILFLAALWLLELIFFLVFQLWFRQFYKALAATMLLLAVYLFFAPLQDGLKSLTPLRFLSKYSLLVPLLVILFLLYLMRLHKKHQVSPRSFRFICLLLIVLIAIDVLQLAYKSRRTGPLPDKIELRAEGSRTSKPDIYLIVADEYAGEEQLRSQLGFNNSAFIESLQSRGFHYIENSRSNYHYTVHSLASMLNLQLLRRDIKSYRDEDFFPLRAAIDQSTLSEFFKAQGYNTYQFSAVGLTRNDEQQPDPYLLTLFEFLHQQTASGRIIRDLGEKFRTKKVKGQKYWYAHQNNELFIRETMDAVKIKGKPKFVYTHLDLPHQPYYFDSSGHPMPFPNMASIGDRYKNYLVYANKKLLLLIDHILANNSSPPVILLLSDHGFRHLPPPANANYFMNLAAVLQPAGNGKEFYPGISNVNIMRVLLNEHFRTNLPLLPDSNYLLAGRGNEFEAH